ncbi:MAG: lamin tail domain-containing protein [Melioribacteraceae bacterium]|nr:lamin tail domain-containing protein [Melioribacteraceae bacterium]MCF8420707.1 lamin tail domain-containing protein [Melioribacteraceae bacterium]
MLHIAIRLSAQVADHTVISEIMFRPAASNSEFIELYNPSDTVEISLTGFAIQYQSSSFDYLVPFNEDSILLPHSYAVILEGDYNFESGIYNELIPDSVLVMKIDNNAFGSAGMSNSSDRTIYLISPDLDTLDSHTYTADNPEGFSDEKILVNSNDTLNWANSKYLHGTPGHINSVSPKNYDLAFNGFNLMPGTPVEGDDLSIRISVKNLGLLEAGNSVINIYDDINFDSSSVEDELIYSENLFDIPPNDSIFIQLQIENAPARNYQLIVELFFPQDQDFYNNNALINFNVSEIAAQFNDIVINEIMYRPLNDEPEWIEIYNRTDSLINLKNWYISDPASSSFLSDADLFVNPGSFVVIADDESIYEYYEIESPVIIINLPSLNNSGDLLMLTDSLNLTIDSVYYSSAWGGYYNGRSLERIDPFQSSTDSINWLTTKWNVNATPGEINTVTQKDFDLAVKSFAPASEYFITGDHAELKTTIQNTGLNNASNIEVKLFYDANSDSIAQPGELEASQILPSIISFDSTAINFTTENFTEGSNSFITVLEHSSDIYDYNDTAFTVLHGVSINEIYGDIVINEIMYSPDSPEPEWIELFNRSNKIINLKNFSVADEADTQTVIENDVVLEPGEYLVLAKDSSIYSFHDVTSPVVINNFPTLNNTDDNVMILDSLSRVIDSVFYYSSWGGRNGKSLERVNSGLFINDSSNWKTTNTFLTGTPGRINSVSDKNYDLGISQFVSTRDYAVDPQPLPVNISVENIGLQNADSYTLRIYHDADYDSAASESELIYTFSGGLISPGSSSDFNFEINEYSLGKNQLIAKLQLDNDEYPDNNISYFQFNAVTINESEHDLVINEIMYEPLNDFPEWIEIYNRSSKTINFNGYQVADLRDTVIINEHQLIINPNEYCIIAEDSNIVEQYDFTSPLIIGDFPTLNNSSDQIKILDSLYRVIDSISYSRSFGGYDGYSLERVDPELFVSDSTNWLSSIGRNKASPGFINTVSKKDHDLKIDSVFSIEPYAVNPEPFPVSIILSNDGKNIIDSYQLKIFLDINSDGEFQESELIGNFDRSNLHANTNITIDYNISGYHDGWNDMAFAAVTSPDQFRENDTVYFRFDAVSINEELHDLVINEILYSPHNDFPEWIEIYNRSGKSIDLKGFQIADNSSTSEKIKQSEILNPSQYCIIADDSTIFTQYTIDVPVIINNFPLLNNSADTVTLLDSLNRLIDSVNYKSTYGGRNGISLERVDSDLFTSDSTNWISSIHHAGATPGSINSASMKEIDLMISNIYSTEPYAIQPVPFPINVDLTNNGLNKIDEYHLKIYLDSNNDSLNQTDELIKTFTGNNMTPGSQINFYYEVENYASGWNNLILISHTDSDQLTDNDTLLYRFNAVVINEAHHDLIINEVMYAPENDTPEWIEIYNRSSKTIDLNGYQVADDSDTSANIDQSLLISPFQFGVIADDSSFFDHYTLRRNVIIQNFPSLNNGKDTIRILDSLDRVIDSIHYSSVLGADAGISIERINPESFLSDSTNWGTSINPAGSTPGDINSLTRKDYDLFLSRVNYTPAKPIIDDDVFVSCSVKNIGKKEISFSVDLLIDNDNDSLNFVLHESLTVNMLAPGDSALIDFAKPVAGIQNTTGIKCSLSAVQDEDTTNNKIHITVTPGYENKSIVINEIMYDPPEAQPEWIELFNASDRTINLKDWQVSINEIDRKITKDDLILNPGEYLIITDDSTITSYFTIPSQYIELRFGNLNNTEDVIKVIDDRSLLIDSVAYNDEYRNDKSTSIELTEINGEWISSIDYYKGTPGRINSIANKNLDLLIKNISVEPRYPVKGENVKIACEIYNAGAEKISTGNLKFIYSEGMSENLLEELTLTDLGAGDSAYYISTNSFVINDSITVAVHSELTDDDSINNRVSKIIFTGSAQKDILISEFMNNPSSDESDWIEFYNNSSKTINIMNWRVSDKSKMPDGDIITNAGQYIEPGKYFAAAIDTSKIPGIENVKIFQSNFGSLGNTNDKIIIYDFRGAVIDHLEYDSFDGEPGRSFERISFDKETQDSSNWITSLDSTGSTIGRQNSTFSAESYSNQSIVINEILYDPDESNSEFIELYNRSDSFVDLGGWKLIDEKSEIVQFQRVAFLLPPDSYFLISSDSNCIYFYDDLTASENVSIINRDLALSNQSQMLKLVDLYNNTIDSVHYNSGWHSPSMKFTKNRSLERINYDVGSNDQLNWSTNVSSAGATPLKENSIFTKGIVSTTGITVSPNPFSPDNDGFEDFTIINYNLTQKAAQMRIKVYDSKGRLVRTLISNQAAGSSGSVIFDGLDDSGRPLRIGIYILFIEAINEFSGTIDVIKKAVVIARKL